MNIFSNQLEQEILRKLRLEKRLNIIRKEKENFLNLIQKYEERLNEKIVISNKNLKKTELELDKFDYDVNK